MEVSQESFERFQKASQEAQQKIVELTANLNSATETINHQTTLLKFSTEDIELLLAFIKSNGLKPPGKFAHA